MVGSYFAEVHVLQVFAETMGERNIYIGIVTVMNIFEASTNQSSPKLKGAIPVSINM